MCNDISIGNIQHTFNKSMDNHFYYVQCLLKMD